MADDPMRARLPPSTMPGLAAGVVTTGLLALAALAVLVGDVRPLAVAVAAATTDEPLAFVVAVVVPGLAGGVVAHRMTALRDAASTVATVGVATAAASVVAGALAAGYRPILLPVLSRYSPWLVPGMQDRSHGPLEVMAVENVPWLFSVGYPVLVAVTVGAGYVLAGLVAGKDS